MKKWLEITIKEIKELEKMGCWKIVKLTSLPPGAKLINCCWVYWLKFRDGLCERHRARLVAMGYQHEMKGVIISRAFRVPPHTLPFVSCLHSQPFLASICWIWMPCALSFQVTFLLESVSIWKARLVTILVRVITYTCSSAYTATCKHLVNITCSVVKFTRRLAWSNFIQMPKDLWLQMLKICGYRCRRVKICGYRCRIVQRLTVKFMQEFEKAVKQDGQLICDVKASLTGFFRYAMLTRGLPAWSA